MRKILVLGLAGILVLMAIGIAMALTAGPTTIYGSYHDLSSSGKALTATNVNQICVFCHTPHSGLALSGDYAYLWNRWASTTTYQTYTSSTMNATEPSTMSGVSAICLSCHDGSVAIGVLNNVYGQNFTATFTQTANSNASYNTGTPGWKMSSGLPFLGTDLRNDHPVGFTYDSALAAADGGLQTPGTNSVTGTTNGTGITLTLFNQKLECATCHNVHRPGATTTGDFPFLAASNNNSSLCLTCHLK